jgi:hypothetical protein
VLGSALARWAGAPASGTATPHLLHGASPPAANALSQLAGHLLRGGRHGGPFSGGGSERTMASTSAAAKPFTLGGVGASPSIDDVVRIAQAGVAVALDPAGAERVKKESPPPKAFTPEPFDAAAAPASAAVELLSAEETRAVLACRLLSLMNGRSGARLALCDFLAGMLNKGVLPALPAAASDSQVRAPWPSSSYRRTTNT